MVNGMLLYIPIIKLRYAAVTLPALLPLHQVVQCDDASPKKSTLWGGAGGWQVCNPRPEMAWDYTQC